MCKRVVTFGGSGFIGSYIIEELVARKYDVISADLYNSQYVDDNYFVQCDIMDSSKVSEVVQGADFVCNLAGYANLDDAVANPVKAIELNILGNMNILEACRAHQVQRFIYASSAYAVSDKGSFYGIGKLTSEKLTEEYYKNFGLEFTIIRYGSVYGERSYPNNYIYNLVKEAMHTNSISHGGDGEEMREYIHAADVARLTLQVMESDDFINEHITLTGVERMSRKEVFIMINEILGNNVDIRLNNDGYNNHYTTTPYLFSPTRSRKLLANPYIDMGQGISECMKNVQAQTCES